MTDMAGLGPFGARLAPEGAVGVGGTAEDIPTVLPYDQADSRTPVLLTSISDIEAFDRELARVTNGLPLSIDIGSVSRVASSRYGEFGVKITDANRAELEARAREIYRRDAERDRANKTATDKWYKFKKSLSEAMLSEMAMAIATILKDILSTISKDGPIRILDAATGSGRLSSAVISALAADIQTARMLERIELHMVDHSSALTYARDNVTKMGVTVKTHSVHDEQYLADAVSRGDRFDIIMSLGHLHRKPFIDAYLQLLAGVLAPDGIVAIGDFHSTMTHHPSHLYTLLESHGVEPVRMGLLRHLFGPLLTPKPCQLTLCEGEAIKDHIRYWDRLLTESMAQGPKGARVRILGGFVSSRQLGAALNSVDLVTDRDSITRAFPRANLPAVLPHKVRPYTDTGVVTMAIRRVRA